MSGGRIALVVLGSVVALVSLALLTAGGAALWAQTTQRDDDGFFTTESQRFETPSYALTSQEIDLGADGEGPDWVIADAAGTMRVRATSEPADRSVFIGVARSADVDAYLSMIADTAGPVALALRGLAEPDRAAVRADVEDSLRRFGSPAGYELPCVALCAVAG